jgi:nucleoid-associated protein YgaU
LSYADWASRYTDDAEPAPSPVRRRARIRRLRRLEARRRHGFLRLAAVVAIVAVGVWAGVRVAHASGDATTFRSRVYTVRSGDTLWGIVSRRYGENVDPRQLVYEVERANHRGGAALSPGEKLTLPYLGP